MAYSVEFAGEKLEEYCKILNVERSVLPDRENFSKSINGMNGSIYTGYRYKESKISLEVVIIATDEEDYMNQVRDLADVLNTPNPSKLIISDEPNKYCYAVLDGSTNLKRKFKTGSFNIDFICHDPTIYSEEWKCFTPDSNNIITLENEGSIETSLTVDVDFSKNACFFQCTNSEGQTVLIGEPRDVTKSSVSLKETVINDKCEASENFTTLPQSLLDNSYRLTNGEFGVGYNGNGIICTNYGQKEEKNWNGTAFKRELGADVDEFEVIIDFVFSSQGANYKPPKPTPPTPSNPKPTQNLGTYKVTARSGLWIEKEPNSKKSSHLHVMARNELVYPTEVKGKWFKHTKKYKNGKTYTGWSYSKYLSKVTPKKKRETKKTRSKKKRTTKSSFFGADGTEMKYPENQMGLLEIYGYDKNGSRMFKMEVADRNTYYENVIPKIFVGERTIIQESSKVPAPKQIKTKDKNGKVTAKNIASGVYGNWNDLKGKFILRREKAKNGQYKWSGTVYKYKDGKIVKTLKTKNAISDSKFSKAGLNYLGFYIGSYANIPEVDLITVTNIKVKRLNINKIKKMKENVEIFKEGDHLQINFESGSVLLNDVEDLTLLDIGSQFFDIETGESEIAVRTDDKEADITVGFQERYI